MCENFSIGDTVCLKTNPVIHMTVEKRLKEEFHPTPFIDEFECVLYYIKSPFTKYLCVWFDKDNKLNKHIFHKQSLKKLN